MGGGNAGGILGRHARKDGLKGGGGQTKKYLV